MNENTKMSQDAYSDDELVKHFPGFTNQQVAVNVVKLIPNSPCLCWELVAI
jgi:hypothetical protein